MADRGGDEEAEGRGRLLSEGLRRVLGSGVNALFVTEEGVRNALGDLKLPKDALHFITQQAEKTRRDVFGLMAKEVKQAFEGAQLLAEMKKLLRDTKVQIRAEITFGDAKTATKTKTRIKKRPSRPRGAEERTLDTRNRR